MVSPIQSMASLALGILCVVSSGLASAASRYPCDSSCPPAIPVCNPPIVAKLGCCTKSPLYPPPPPVVAPVTVQPTYVPPNIPCISNRYVAPASRSWRNICPDAKQMTSPPVAMPIGNYPPVFQGYYTGRSEGIAYKPIRRPFVPMGDP